jgi:hypothetical protein
VGGGVAVAGGTSARSTITSSLWCSAQIIFVKFCMVIVTVATHLQFEVNQLGHDTWQQLNTVHKISPLSSENLGFFYYRDDVTRI